MLRTSTAFSAKVDGAGSLKRLMSRMTANGPLQQLTIQAYVAQTSSHGPRRSPRSPRVEWHSSSLAISIAASRAATNIH